MVTTNKNQGFTLIEIAMWLIVIGLLTLPVLELYKIRMQTGIKSYNQGQFQDILEAINKFAFEHQRYPLPSSLLLGPGDTDFGQEVASGPPGPPYPNCASWPTPEGVCRIPSEDIFFGAVPFEVLGLQADDTTDRWGNKILYVVSADKTVSLKAGEIDVSDGIPPGTVMVRAFEEIADGLQTEAEAQAHDFILISHGASGGGAYSLHGNLVQACPAAASGLDSDNCDFDEFFIQSHSQAAGDRGGGVATNDTPGPNFYDDFTTSQEFLRPGNWNQSLDDSSFAVTNMSRVGIGTETPDAKVHVRGDVKATAILTNNICRKDGECFEPETLLGAKADMDCGQNDLDGDEPVLWLANQQVYCATPVDNGGLIISNGMSDGGLKFEFPASNFGRIKCGDIVDAFGNPQLMVGIDADGDPICGTP